MPNHDVRAIANEFWRRAQSEGRSLTNMQMQKLPYIAHGWALALRGEPLVAQSPEAWKYGPVYPELYDALKQYGPGDVTDYIHENDANPFCEIRGQRVTANLNDEERRLIDAVWNNYKNKSGFMLSTLTHQPGTPWTTTYQNGNGRHNIINDDLIRQHYLQLSNPR